MIFKILLLVSQLVRFLESRGEPPFLTQAVITHQTFNEGQNIKLTCPVGSSDFLEWSKDGSSINKGWDRFRDVHLGLKIKNVTHSDSGRYICTATNGFGTMDIEYYVYILSSKKKTDSYQKLNSDDMNKRPYFLYPEAMKNPHKIHLVGDSVHISCDAEGNPSPVVLWFKDGNPIDNSYMQNDWILDSDDLLHHRNPKILKLSHLKKSDSGSYTCRVFNNLGVINFTYVLEVVDYLSKPIISELKLSNSSVYAGNSVIFDCSVQSQAVATIQWLKRINLPKNERVLNSTFEVKGQQFIILSSKAVNKTNDKYQSSLKIEEVEIADGGMYVCLGANDMGYSFKSLFLTVKSDTDNANNDPERNTSLALIISVPALVIFILMLMVFVMKIRKNANNRSSDKNSCPAYYPTTSHTETNCSHPSICKEHCSLNPYIEQVPPCEFQLKHPPKCIYKNSNNSLRRSHTPVSSSSDNSKHCSTPKEVPLLVPQHHLVPAYHEMNIPVVYHGMNPTETFQPFQPSNYSPYNPLTSSDNASCMSRLLLLHQT